MTMVHAYLSLAIICVALALFLCGVGVATDRAADRVRAAERRATHAEGELANRDGYIRELEQEVARYERFRAIEQAPTVRAAVKAALSLRQQS